MNSIIGQIPKESLLGQIPDSTLSLIRGCVIFILIFLIFLIIRQLVLWYWRINERTESLKRIADSLEKIAVAADFLATDTDDKNDKLVAEVKPVVENKKQT